jgi:hypothetical protein
VKPVFYVLENSRITGSAYETEFIDEDPVNVGDAPRCEACGEYVGMLRWLPPYRVELELWGRDFGDLVFGAGGNPLVSERFTALFRQEGLTGLEGFDPVEVVRIRDRRKPKRKSTPPTYLYVNVVRSKAAVDDKRSGIERSGPVTCQECRSYGVDRAKRIIIDPAGWAGEDLFIARGLTGRIIASERFKSFCDRHEIRNAVLIPAEEYSFDHYAGVENG